MKVTRINTGIYKIEVNGKKFNAEKTEDGQWQLVQIIYNNKIGMSETEEYCNHFLTLKSCKIASSQISAEYMV